MEEKPEHTRANVPNLKLRADVPGRLRKGIFCPVWGYTWDMGSCGPQIMRNLGRAMSQEPEMEEEAEPEWQREG